MAKRYSPEEAVIKMREVDVYVAQGKGVVESCRMAGVSKNTYATWKQEYGGMSVDHAKRLKELEKENLQLKKLVANLSLDNSILKEVASGNF